MRALWLSLVVLALTGCEKKKDPTPDTKQQQVKADPAPAAAKPAADEVIVIGEVGSVTGSEAAFGISTSHGIEMAVDEANAAGGVKGKKLKVVLYDDQSKPEEAASAAVTRLITQDKVTRDSRRGRFERTRSPWRPRPRRRRRR